jgi:hypothetical protein
MLRRHLGTTGLALLAVLVFPSVGHASIWDWWWGLSGPQMIGPVLHCEYDLQRKGGGNAGERDVIECRAIDYLFFNKLKPRPDRVVWLSLDAGYYFSTDKNADGNEFGWFDTQMIALEPLAEVLSYRSPENNFMVHHGLFGITYNVLWGGNFDTFDKAGFKFRPVGVTIGRRFNASFTLRYYPTRFVSEDFGIVNPTQVKTGGEWVKGFTVGWLWGPR